MDSLGKATGNMRRWTNANYKDLNDAQKEIVDELNTEMTTIIKSKDKDLENGFLNSYHKKYI